MDFELEAELWQYTSSHFRELRHTGALGSARSRSYGFAQDEDKKNQERWGDLAGMATAEDQDLQDSRLRKLKKIAA